ncbi:hypothetical protein [Pedobacter punctiformis]|uniref:PorV/PorQ family protein n=1 Tax=Pedobacter punctiformis TaxID=3004097 RepID=A0ABT4L6Z5_9SPHI|nr:hypothetical protein [Pedobacter sp. HCMS5-2]MCZ4243696.1 hypothetical protein [Pedobacter sp. HCMS5-2]
MKIFSFLLIFVSTSTLFAQNNLGPRLTAMGNNGASTADIWSLQANPAGITGITSPSISLNYVKHLFSNEISTQGLVGVIPFGNNYTGISFQRYGFSAYNEMKIGFAYAKKFDKKLAIALDVNYFQLKIPNYGSSTGFSVDIGLLYHFSEQLSFGAFTANPSRQKYSAQEIEAQIPSSFNIGANYKASDKVLIATTISKVLNQSVDVKLGIDYKILDLLSLRAGLSAKPFKQYAGFGLNYKKFLLDMATAYDPNLGYAPQIAIGYAF